MSLNIGDVVTLNSGGEKMTVIYVVGSGDDKTSENMLKFAGYKEGDVVCQWFHKAELKKETFRKNTVTPAQQ